jgi:hypothetical protein
VPACWPGCAVVGSADGGGAETSGVGDGWGKAEGIVPGADPAPGTGAVLLRVSGVPAAPDGRGDCCGGGEMASSGAVRGGGGACGWGTGAGTVPGSMGPTAVAPAGMPLPAEGTGPEVQEPSHSGSVSAAVVAMRPPALQMPAMSAPRSHSRACRALTLRRSPGPENARAVPVGARLGHTRSRGGPCAHGAVTKCSGQSDAPGTSSVPGASVGLFAGRARGGLTLRAGRQ